MSQPLFTLETPSPQNSPDWPYLQNAPPSPRPRKLIAFGHSGLLPQTITPRIDPWRLFFNCSLPVSFYSKWFEPRSISSLSSVIVRVSVVLKRTVEPLKRTVKMTTAQVVETSVTVTNSSFQNYTHPDDHTRQTTVSF